MNTKLFRTPGGLMGRTPNLPMALRASVGVEGGGGGGAQRTPAGRAAPAAAPTQRAAPPQLSAGVGWEAHPNAQKMQNMLVATVGAQGIGGDMLNAQRCIPQYPGQVVASMEGLSCPPDQYAPPPANIDVNTYNYIMAQINLAKYATAPTRLGWLCDSISYVTPAIGNAPVIAANAALGAINLTPTRSFTMDAFVMASGTANDPLYFVTGFTYQGTNYVGTGPWISTLYTPTSGCCLCVRVIPIVEKNTTIAIAGTNGNVQNVFLFGELFGYTLFSGSP